MAHASESAPGAPGSANLRQRAVAKLNVGSPTARGRTGQTEALAVLHQLACTPETAGDALALLHELQVHQVELEMQQEELGNSRAELETALLRQTALVERAPAGFLSIDANGVLCAINLAGARLLGAARDDLLGQPLTSHLSPPGIGALQALLARARDGLATEACELRLLPVAGVSRTLHATADKDMAPGCFVLVLMAAGPT